MAATDKPVSREFHGTAIASMARSLRSDYAALIGYFLPTLGRRLDEIERQAEAIAKLDAQARAPDEPTMFGYPLSEFPQTIEVRLDIRDACEFVTDAEARRVDSRIGRKVRDRVKHDLVREAEKIAERHRTANREEQSP